MLLKFVGSLISNVFFLIGNFVVNVRCVGGPEHSTSLSHWAEKVTANIYAVIDLGSVTTVTDGEKVP